MGNSRGAGAGASGFGLDSNPDPAVKRHSPISKVLGMASVSSETIAPRLTADHTDPLLECLVALTRLHGRPLTAVALTAGLPVAPGGMTPLMFVRAAEGAQYSARIARRKLSELSALLLPAVVLLEDGNACLALEFSSTGKGRKRVDKLKVLQPESGGEAEIIVDELQQQCTGEIIFVRPQYQYDARAPEVLQVRSRHWFWGTILSSWTIYRDVLVASLLINTFALASPLFVMNVYDRVVPNNALETLWVLAIGVGVLYGFDLVMRTLRSHFLDIAGRKADVLLSARLYQKVLGLKMAVRPVSVGAFANNLRDFESIREFIASASIVTIVDLPFVVLFVGTAYLLGGPVAFVPLAGMALIAIYGVVIQGPLVRSVQASIRTSAQKHATLIESLSALETVKTLGAEGPLQRRWEQATGHMAKWSVRTRALSTSVLSFATFVTQLNTVGVVVFGVYLIADGEMSMGALIAVVILSQRALAPMAGVANLATRYHQARTALSTLNGIMTLPEERPAGKVFVRRPDLKGEIVFQNVSFEYPEASLNALTDVDFTIKPGEHVALIGRIGSGKTTIQRLIMALHDPTDGAVQVDGVDVRQIDPADLRRSIGYVSQDIVLFYGSLRDNITAGAPYADDADVLRAAEIAGLRELVDRHPLGFDMNVGERGEALSGGQRQSLAVARAVLLDPPILLLDEPTNAMDNTSEAALKVKLKEFARGKTLIAVTHRASLLELVDRIIVMDTGRVVADGPKEQVAEALREGRIHVARP
ncbi:MAG: type I secretion system permease/ATPase [Gammaproteobacteria bacterium]